MSREIISYSSRCISCYRDSNSRCLTSLRCLLSCWYFITYLVGNWMVTYFSSWWYHYVTSGRIYIRNHFTWSCRSRSYYLYLSIGCSRYTSVDLRIIQYISYCLRRSIGWRIYSGWYSSRSKFYLVSYHYFSSSFIRDSCLSFFSNLILHFIYTRCRIGCYLYLTCSCIYIYS